MPRKFESEFAKSIPFDGRLQEAQRMREKHPERVPVIVEKYPGSKIADLDKKKFLVPVDLTVGQFMHVLRKRIKLQPSGGIFLFVNNVMPPVQSLMGSVYEEYKSDDLFLYLTYSSENIFGNDEVEN